MSLRKYLNVLFMLLIVLAMACGQAKEVVDEEELGEDDHALQTAAAESQAGSGGAASQPAAVADAATLTGLVKFEGTAPKRPPLQMSADPYCESQHPTPQLDEEVVLGPAGELANVIVFVKDVPGNYPAPTTAALLDQKGCHYVPHVSAVQVGQPIEIRNSDATLHNVHAMPEVNSQFNEGQPVQGMTSVKKFDKAEIKPFRIKCDVHGWMKSYMAVLPHPYHDVSHENGAFSIANLPPGNYTLVAWHEKYGQQEQQITVGPKEQKQVTFVFKG